VARSRLPRDSPQTYVRFAVELYEKGVSRIGHLFIKPSDGCRNCSLPDSMSPADWLTVASLRDSMWITTWIASGTILPRAPLLATLRYGLSNRATWTSSPRIISWRAWDPSDIDDLNRYYSEGRRVILAINDAMLYAARQSETTYESNHIVGLTSLIARTPQGFGSRSSVGAAKCRFRKGARYRKRISWAICMVMSLAGPSEIAKPGPSHSKWLTVGRPTCRPVAHSLPSEGHRTVVRAPAVHASGEVPHILAAERPRSIQGIARPCARLTDEHQRFSFRELFGVERRHW
jgi:hypothetical protein